MTVVPESVLALLTWGNLERGVCGDREITLGQLKAACECMDFISLKQIVIHGGLASAEPKTTDQREVLCAHCHKETRELPFFLKQSVEFSALQYTAWLLQFVLFETVPRKVIHCICSSEYIKSLTYHKTSCTCISIIYIFVHL